MKNATRNRRKQQDSWKFLMDTRDPIVRRIPRQYRAWVVITAGVCLQFSYGGLVYSFGNILPYLVSYIRQNINPTQTNGSMIWLQSLMSGIPFAMLVGGIIEKRLGPRAGACIGCAMYTGGVFLSYFTIQKSYFLLLFTLGLVASFGQGIAYVNVLTQCQRWVPKENVGLVSGIITSGFASGAFVLAPIESKFVNPNNAKVGEDGFFHDKELLDRVPQMFLLLSGIFLVIQLISLLFIAEPSVDEAGYEEASLLALENEDETLEGNDDQSDDDIDTLNLRRPVPVVVIPKMKLMSSSTLLMLSATLLLNAVWVQTTSGLFKAYGQSFIKDDFFLATVNSFAAAANCISRVLWGVFADRTSYSFTMIIACSIGSILMWGLPFVKFVADPTLFFFWVAGMFTIIGSTYTLIPYAVHKAFGPANFSIAYGCVQISLAISGFVAAVDAQFILPYVGFDVLFLLTGVGTAISLIITMLIRRTQYGKNL